MKKNIYLILLLLVIVLIYGSFVYFEKTITSKKNINIVIDVKKNMPLKKSLETLDFSNDIIFRVYLKFFRNEGKNIKAGYYEIEGDYSISEIIDELEKGHEKYYKFTIIEGSRVQDVIDKLVQDKRIDEKKFYEELSKVKFDYPTPNNNFEGYFYPETYKIPEYAVEKDIINIFLGEFLKKFPSKKYINKEEFYEKLILASIIEREAAWNKEKPIMASVFYNRIDKGMQLAADSTVNYIFGYKKKRILYADLKVESPYNTYINKGLPPGPIANPTKSSVDATYNPAKTDYLFFVTKGGGEHFFSKTYKEHIDFQNKATKNKKIKEQTETNEKNKLEKEKLTKENKDKEKLEKEKLEKEKLEKELLEQEKLPIETAEEDFSSNLQEELDEAIEKSINQNVKKMIKEELQDEIKDEVYEELENETEKGLKDKINIEFDETINKEKEE